MKLAEHCPANRVSGYDTVGPYKGGEEKRRTRVEKKTVVGEKVLIRPVHAGVQTVQGWH